MQKIMEHDLSLHEAYILMEDTLPISEPSMR